MSKPKIIIEPSGDAYKAYLVGGNGKVITVGGGWAATDYLAAEWSKSELVKKLKRLKRLFAEAEIIK